MTDESSCDDGEPSLILFFSIGSGDIIKVTWPRGLPLKPMRVVLIPSDIDYFNKTTVTNATRSGKETIFTRTLRSEFRGHKVVDVRTLVRLKQGRLTDTDISNYERRSAD